MDLVVNVRGWFSHIPRDVLKSSIPAIITLIVSLWVTLRLFRISTYPVPQITLGVEAQPADNHGSPIFTATIRHVGEKTTIVTPALYIYMRDPGPEFPVNQPKRKREWRRERWQRFYMRILPDIVPGGCFVETLPPPQQRDGSHDWVVGYILRHFPHYFRFDPYIPVDEGTPLPPHLYSVGKTISGPATQIPVLVRIDYRVGIQSRPRQFEEREYRLHVHIGIPQGTQYGFSAVNTGGFARKRRLFRGFYDDKDVSEGAPWVN